MCSLPTRIGSAAHSAWGHASAEDDDLAWLAKAKAKAKAGPRLQTNGGSPIAIASLAAIAGMFIMMDSRAGDQRLVLAGQWPGSLLAARLALIALAAMVATTISLAITAAVADVRQWGVYIAANLLVAATYALIGVLAHPKITAQFVSSVAAGDTTVIVAQSDTTLESDQGKALIEHLRADAPAVSQGLDVRIGGLQALSLDLDSALYRNFPRTILVILVTTYLLLLLMFRSVLLPLKAVLMNILSVGATYGALVYIFQGGNLGFPRVAFIDAIIPILLFCVLFGLSMDYEVFLLSRIREEWLQSKDNRAAVASGLEKTAGVITSAACLFVIVTGAFAFASLVTTKEIGVGMTVAVLVDATFIRLLLVPATMRLLGRWNWWLPGRPVPPR